MGLRLIRQAGRTLIRAGNKLLNHSSTTGAIWVDVGAHLGETTFSCARNNPSLTVYAFEPNWRVARTIMGRLANFVVFPMAVSEKDGVAEFYINSMDQASSLLLLDPEGLRNWKGSEALRVECKTVVPTIRLDTFMQSMEIQRMDYLKVDAQGADLAVIRSAGSRLKDIRKITLEVDVTPVRLYQGSGSRDEIVQYLRAYGFKLVSTNSQSVGQEENLTFVQNRTYSEIL